METIKIKREKGKIIVVEQIAYTGGPKVGETFEIETEVYETPEAAGKYANQRLSENSNLVFVAMSTKVVDGITYYYPGFNVWD